MVPRGGLVNCLFQINIHTYLDSGNLGLASPRLVNMRRVENRLMYTSETLGLKGAWTSGQRSERASKKPYIVVYYRICM